LTRVNQPRRSRIRAFSTTATADEKSAETFFAEESVSWSSLGVSDRLSRAVSNVGLNRPSLVQAACIPSILSGTDVVVAAETGSGKTHGYLIPLIDKLLCKTPNSSEDAVAEGGNEPHQLSLVLCPNVMLCEQVARMANGICDDNGESLLTVAAVCGRQGWPAKEPDIIVSTPAALLNYLYAIDPDRRRRTDFIRDVKYVVFDEADMLLCGSFQNQIIRLINMLRFDEKLLSRSKKSPVVKPDDLNLKLEDYENVEADFPLGDEDDSDSQSNADVDNSKAVTESVEVKKRTGWRRVREIYERSKQYIFVAATLPLNGKRTAGGELKRLFPEARWISGNYLHCHNPRLEQKWVEVTIDTQVDALIEAVNQGFNKFDKVSRTMVFANTVDAVEAVATVVRGAGIECYRYHRDSSLEERTNSLIEFQEKGGVFVCTDAAARGLDIQNVSHVIQAEFASSAVDFLHRVGRTARAGQPGLVTSLYNEASRDLVTAVLQAGNLDQPVEKAFSRKRSFRNRIKKRASESKVNDALSTGNRIAVN
jgi:superfamily II DNA/RNA helicase